MRKLASTVPIRIAAVSGFALILCFGQGDVRADDGELALNAQRGWELLRTKPYLPPDFDQGVFDQLWRLWPEDERRKAAAASPAERQLLTRRHYGLPSPDQDDTQDAMRGPGPGYVATPDGWVMSCLVCHSGSVAGRFVPGLPNSHLALQSLVEDVRLTKLAQFKKLSHLDLASIKLPFGTTHGTTNAVMFGVILGAERDADMRIDRSRPKPVQNHHDMDAPPLWNVRYKSSLYADGFAPKNHRILMQFLLLSSNGPQTLTAWEPDFRHILAWIESLKPPPWRFLSTRLSRKQAERFLRNPAPDATGRTEPLAVTVRSLFRSRRWAPIRFA